MSRLRRARSRLLFALSASPRLRWRGATSKCLTLFVVIIFLFCIFAKIVFLFCIFVSTQNLRTRIASAPPVRWQRAWTATRGEVGSKDYLHVLYIYAYCIMLYNMHILRGGFPTVFNHFWCWYLWYRLYQAPGRPWHRGAGGGMVLPWEPPGFY